MIEQTPGYQLPGCLRFHSVDHINRLREVALVIELPGLVRHAMEHEYAYALVVYAHGLMHRRLAQVDGGLLSPWLGGMEAAILKHKFPAPSR